MGLTSILRNFGIVLMIVGLAMIGPIIAAAMTQGDVEPYLFSLIVTLIVGAGAVVVSLGRRRKSDFRSALVVILMWWCVTPAFAALPFVLSGMSFSDAYFEAVSALTTTGAWLSNEAAGADYAGALWRAQLQWIGGLASLAIAAAIFIRPAFIGIDTILPPFSRGDHESYLRAIRKSVAAFFLIYAGGTAIALVMLNAGGAPLFDALILALSGVSTGGFVLRPDGIESYQSTVSLAMFFIMIFGAMNLVVFARLVRGIRADGDDYENRTFLFMAAVVGVLFWVLSGANGIDHVIPQLFNAVSLLSTSGHIIGEAPPLTVALVTAMIGGAAVSTAGGFKILRWLVIMRRAREELRCLVLPNAVQGVRRVSNEFGVWTHFLVFTLMLGVLVIAISAGGRQFDIVAATATAALSNTGPLLYITAPDISGFEYFDPFTRSFLVVAMIAGRLEAAVALALFNPAFWRA